MTGLELSKEYWEQVGMPAFLSGCPEILSRCAAGLVGEGSDCFGFDDEISRDHDWGPGFCLWLRREDMELYGEAARQVYSSLPECFKGFRRLRISPMTEDRVGVIDTDSFYGRFTAIGKLPETSSEWNCVPEAGLAAATNGSVFFDSTGYFSDLRRRLLDYYPDEVRKKKLAAHLALAAQSGQYNLYRCMKRADRTALFMTCANYVEHIQAAVFLLNKVYRPYYKWAHRAMRGLPLGGALISGLIEELTSLPENAGEITERIASEVILLLKQQDLSNSTDSFLMPHAVQIQNSITDPYLSSLHLMQE